MKIRELFTRIGFDINDKPLKQLDAGIKNVKKSILLISGAAAAAGGMLAGLALNVAKVADKAKKTAQALGLTTEAYQELQYVAKLGGMEQEEYNTALRQLANSANDASLGLETYKRAYDALGISVTDSNGKLKNSDVLISEVADEFSQMKDGIEKTAIANDLFGRSGAKMIPLLNEGSAAIDKLRQEARKHAIITDEQAQKAAEFNNALSELFWSIGQIKNQIGLKLIPTLHKYVDAAQKWLDLHAEIIKQKINYFLKILIGYMKTFYTVAKGGLIVIRDTVNAFGGLERVIKYVTYAMASFLALKFLYGIGLIAQGVWGLVAAFKGLTIAAITGKLALLALPLLIGVAIAALIIGIQDVISYFQGKDSLTGRIVDAFEKKYPEAIEKTKQALREVLGLFKEVAKSVFTSPGEAVSEVGAQVGRATGKAYPGEGSLWDKLKFFAKSVQIGHTNMPPSSYQTVNSPNVSVNSPITVNIPPGTPAQDVGPRVQAGIKDAMGEMLRQTYWSTSPKVIY